jgi:hypothetical protein
MYHTQPANIPNPPPTFFNQMTQTHPRRTQMTRRRQRSSKTRRCRGGGGGRDSASNARTSRPSRTSKAAVVTVPRNRKAPNYAALLAAHVKSGDKVRLREFLKTELPDALRRKLCTIADVDETLPPNKVVFKLQKKLTDSSPRGHLLAEAILLGVGGVLGAVSSGLSLIPPTDKAFDINDQMTRSKGAQMFVAAGTTARGYTTYRKYTKHKDRHNAYLAALK